MIDLNENKIKLDGQHMQASWNILPSIWLEPIQHENIRYISDKVTLFRNIHVRTYIFTIGKH